MGHTPRKEKLERTWFPRVEFSLFNLPNTLLINNILLKGCEPHRRDLN